MEDVTPEFDAEWKKEAIRIAVQEQIYAMGVDELNIEALFKRAKIIYITGYDKNIHTWNELAKEKANIQKQTKEEKKNKDNEKTETTTHKDNENTKTCPACQEKIPKAWKKHTYKNNGDKCGHVFT